ncbi:MAG: hypothetical protein J6Y48_12595, partial [Clostridia bacterium]|nr:hypothetical protein [Clostridia bacterium]
MKKSLFAVIALILIMTVCTCQAADYTLPEKMYNQLAIGSGLKGSFSITSEGDTLEIPFLKNILDTRFIKTVSDAEYKIRGIASGKDLHYYIFQSNDQDQQNALSELYQKDGICYFRSDMVQGKILQFPSKEDFLKSVIPAGSENINPAQFISNILSVSENEQKDRWDPVLTRYQNELEMWLAGFAVDAETVKLDSGSSALDFTYEIPMDEVYKQIITLFGEFASDPEINTLLDSIMTAEEKALYLNANLLYYYQDTLNSFDMSRILKMKKRVSAVGEVLSFGLELPLDEHSTGYNLLCVDSISGLTVYTLRNQEQVMQLGIPEKTDIQNTSAEKEIWIAKVFTDSSRREAENNFSVRINIKKTNSTYKKGEGDSAKNHEEDLYEVMIENNASYLPADIDLTVIPEFDTITANINLHYSSQYAQNKATTLEIQANVKQGDTQLQIQGKVTTAAPWIFMPFE